MTLLSIIDQGYVIAIVGWVIVFVALVGLFLLFSLVPKVLVLFQKKQCSKTNREDCQEGQKTILTGEINAAISTALFLYFNENHDEESNMVTIKKVSKAYSPWSSKIYSLNNYQKNNWSK